jgi:hypothetical protein
MLLVTTAVAACVYTPFNQAKATATMGTAATNSTTATTTKKAAAWTAISILVCLYITAFRLFYTSNGVLCVSAAAAAVTVPVQSVC